MKLHNEENPIRVSSYSPVGSVAGAIAAAYKHYGKVYVSAIGGGALNQALKAVATARGFLVTSGVDLITIPYFIEKDIEGEVKTVMMLRLENR